MDGAAPNERSIYEIRVTGRLTPRAVRALSPLEAEVAEPESVLAGRLDDPAKLASLLAQLAAEGAEVISLRRTPAA